MKRNPSVRDDHITLYELCNGLKRYIDKRLKNNPLWVIGEINNLKKHSNGHYYLDLVEMRDGKTVAKMQANIWGTTLSLLKEKIGDDIDNILDNGNSVLFQLSVSFHEVYGLKAIIHDLDLNYTLGELERKRQETIDKLKKKNLLDKNKQHYLPVVVQNFVLIASEGSSGYKDFVNQIANNSSGYRFNFEVLNTLVQGERAEEELIRRLYDAAELKHMDAVLILRGGGSKLDLEVFNSYDLCFAIANHPMPVLTGIGHETDVCVADFVSYESLKTPTALAEFLHDRAQRFEQKVIDRTKEICRKITNKIYSQHQLLVEHRKEVKLSSTSLISKQKDFFLHSEKAIRGSKKNLFFKVDNLNLVSTKISARVREIQSDQSVKLHKAETKLRSFSSLQISRNHNQLTTISKLLYNIHPERLVERGFATVIINKKLMTKETVLKIGDELMINVFDKEITCQIIQIKDQWTLNLMNKLLKD
ncbi:MAG: exodeoxyribonuclease VII large subunit [Chitinophagales bacterium]|nr:exodeoxyribonuclease VII large subunit [Chitinophagales bacterium]